MPWTNVSKPTGSTYTNIAKPADGGTIGVGYYVGSLGLTYSNEIILTDWININKPSGSSYTSVAKPTD